MVNTLVSLVKIKWQVELTWAVFSHHFQATNLTILVFYPTLFSERKGKKLDWFSYTFGFWISAHIKDTKKLQGDNSVEAQRSNVEVNVRESMVKVLVIETNWKQSLWIPRCCCKQTVCISCECDKVSKQFSLFSFTGKWPCWLWGLSMHWHHFRKGGIIVLIFFKLNLCSLFPRNFVFIFETSPASEARNFSNMNIVFVISTL